MVLRSLSLGLGLAIVISACSGTAEPAATTTASTDAAPPEAAPTPPDADAGVHAAQLISSSPDSTFEAETDLAVTADGRLVAAWIATDPKNAKRYSRIGYAFSNDDGATWSTPAYAATPDGSFASDPALAVDATGKAYLSWLDVEVDGNGKVGKTVVKVATSPSGAKDFGAPVTISDPTGNALHDHPWITVTPAGTLVAVFSSFASEDGSSGTTGIAASSKDGGATWKTATIAKSTDANAFYNLYFPCAANGRLYVTYWGGDKRGAYVGMRTSDDEGATFGDEVVVSDLATEQGEDFPTCVASGDSVWIAYGTSDAPPTGEADQPDLNAVRLAASHDKGKTFTRTDVAPRTGSFLHPRILRHDDATMDVVYYAGKADGDVGGGLARVHISAGGAPSPAATLEAPITFLLDRASPKWLGDYIGVAAHGGKVFAAFADNASGTSHVAFASASE